MAALFVVALLVAHSRQEDNMATKSTRPAPKWITVLERQPEYLRAIGTVAVEMVNLELMLSDLLGAILAIPQTADAIFCGPQATSPRLIILKGVAKEMLKEHPAYSKAGESVHIRGAKVG